VNGGSRQDLNQPFYGAMLTLRWDLFTGFDRYYGVHKAMAQRNASRSQLKALKVDVIATVWKDYYHFLSAKRNTLLPRRWSRRQKKRTTPIWKAIATA